MKKYESPEIEVVKFNAADVIAVSGNTGGNGTVTPPDEF